MSSDDDIGRWTKVHVGGLFRCCVGNAWGYRGPEPKVGDRLVCPTCGEAVEWTGTAWKWAPKAGDG